jgi:hypothetical protein
LKSNVSKKNILEVLEVFNYIRKQVAFGQRLLNNPHLSRIKINEDKDLFLVDYEHLKINLNPLQKVIYLFLLENKNGIYPRNLYQYKNILLDTYQKISPQINLERMNKSINRLCDPTTNSFNEQSTRIKREFKKALKLYNQSIIEQYLIKTNEKGARYIGLDRVLVT